MRERRFGLRGVLTVLAVAVTSLALTVLVLLLIMTQYSSRVSAALANSVENVRAVEETQIALLRHERDRDPQLEGEMLRNLASVRAGATAETREAIARADALVREYIDAGRAAAPSADLQQRSEHAFRVLDEISDLNIAEARSARDTAGRWDRRLNLLGSLAVALVLLLTGSLLWWMHRHAFQPVL